MARFLAGLSLALTALVLAAALFAAPTTAAAQSSFGIPPFSSVGGGPDAINLSNLGIVYTIPVFSRAGRGSPFSIVQSLQGTIWSPGYNSGGVLQWLLSFPPPNNGVGFVFYSGPVHRTCNDGGTVDYYVYTFSAYYDSTGTSHPFNLAVSDLNDGGGTCVNVNKQYPSTKTGVSSDASGVTMTVTDSPLTAVATLRDGTVIHVPLVTYSNGYWAGTSGPSTATDSNGNQITGNGTSITDTLGTSAVTFGSNTVSYTAPSGATATFTLTTSRYNVQTAFNCPGVAEFPSTPFTLASGFTLADGSSYAITYEPTSPGSQNITGRIASVRLPTGATISYAYTGGDTGTGIVCADGSTGGFNRTTPDGTWHYLRSNIVQGTSSTTITDPLGNNTVINFTGNYETLRQVYTGAISGTPVETVTTSGSPPAGEMKVYRSLNGGPQSESDTFYNSYGLMTAKNEYDFGATTPTRKTTITYDQTIGNGVVDRPSTVTVTDGSGNFGSQTTYTYDQDEVAGTLKTSGASQLSTVTCTAPSGKCRGNVTTVANYITSSTYLTKTFTHYDTGQVYTATDVNSAATQYTYGACGKSFPTNVSLPLSLSESYAWNCAGGVQASSTDENNKTSYTNYTTDPYFWRPNSTQDQLGNTSNLTYASLVQGETSLEVTGTSYVDVVKTLDNLGRPSLSQTRQAHGSSSFDTAFQSYDSDGRPLHAFMPCVSGLGVGCSTPSTTTTYDGFGRPLSVTDGGGGTTTYVYPQNDVLITVSPAPAGENPKKSQLEYDGLGNLSSVCEITSASGSATCGQTTSQTGYWTRYKYDPLGRLIGICQDTTQPLSVDCVQNPSTGQQTRTYAYDGLGRKTSETNPENGTSNYTYDTDSACGTSNGDLVKKVDANGNKSCYSYDALHRVTDVLISKNGTCTPPVERFRYDSTSNGILPLPGGYSATNTSGRMIEAWTGDCVWPTPASGYDSATDEWFAYSARGEMTDLWESTTHVPGYYHGTASYAANGALSSLGGVPGYTAITYGLDAEARPNTATQGTTNLVTGVTYTTASQPQTISLGAGDSDSYGYDSNTGRMTSYTFTVNGVTDSGGLTWNPNGTLGQLLVTDHINSGGSQTCTYGSTSTPGYDDLGRLISANCGSVWSQTFSYDQYNNISKSGSSSWIPGYNPANNHALGVTYDANGNITNDTFHKYGWYVDNKLGSTDSTTCTIFSSRDGTCILYDAFGREVEKGVNGAYTEVMYTPAGKTAIMNGLTTTLNAYFPLPGGATYNQTGTANGSGYFWHKDWLGSVRLSSSVQNRTVYFDRAFAPYGEMYNNFGNTAELNFTGDTQDSFSGLLFDTPNRELHPVQGRWISPDPAGAGSNLYAYVGNSPLNSVDPLGLHDPNELATYNYNFYCGGCGGDNFFQSELDASNRNIDFSFNSFVDWTNHQTFDEQYYNLPGKSNPIQEGLNAYAQYVDDNSPSIGIEGYTPDNSSAAPSLQCNSGFIQASVDAWKRAGVGFQKTEAGFFVLGTTQNPTFKNFPFTNEVMTITGLVIPSGTFALVHTHPNSAAAPPSPGDIANSDKVQFPFYVLSSRGLYVHEPGTTSSNLLRPGMSWMKPCK